MNDARALSPGLSPPTVRTFILNALLMENKQHCVCVLMRLIAIDIWSYVNVFQCDHGSNFLQFKIRLCDHNYVDLMLSILVGALIGDADNGNFNTEIGSQINIS